jgi:hypothetical protein
MHVEQYEAPELFELGQAREVTLGCSCECSCDCSCQDRSDEMDFED